MSEVSRPIRYVDRESGKEGTEKVFGEGFLRWTYGNPLGACALHVLVKRAFFSRLYGKWMSRPASSQAVAGFIREYGIDMRQFVEPAGGFANFNEFFFRKLAPGARPVESGHVAVFPADARHMGFPDAAAAEGIFVKGQHWDVPALLGQRPGAPSDWARKFEHGAVVLSRLCPVDYHRFHFPVDGTVTAEWDIHGPLASVSPLALRRKIDWLWTNRRSVTVLETADFGEVVFIEVGATCVGSIVQTHFGGKVAKGDEKGYFAFGGSTVITVFEPGRVELAPDLLGATRAGVELLAKMGTLMGRPTCPAGGS